MVNVFRKMKVRKINEALGIELQDWQVNYIFSKKTLKLPEKSSYKTITIMLRQMLNTKSKYIWSMKEPLSYAQLTAKNLSDWTLLYRGTHKPNFRSRNYLLSWRQIYKKLNDAGLRLAKVIWLK